MIDISLYEFLLTILVSFFCGFIIGIERTRVSAQYGARDHIFFSIISTSLIILYEDFFSKEGLFLIIIIFACMVIFLLIGSIYRLFHTDNPGYTTTLSMLLSMITGILSYYNYFLAIFIATLFLIILATKKQFYKIKKLKSIEWTGTIEFIAIVVLLYILIPADIIIAGINLRNIVIIFITILAIKYFSYFILKSSAENNLYYISFLGGFAHSEATTLELAKVGASSSSVWLVIQTMLIRMLFILLLGAIDLFWLFLLPIIMTTSIGIIGSFMILQDKQTSFELESIENPLSLRGAFLFTGTYLLAVFVTLGLETLTIQLFTLDIYWYYIIAFLIGLLSGGASSLFTATAFGILVNAGNALIMLTIGLSAATINKLFYSIRYLNKEKNKKKYTLHLFFYIFITISILAISTWISIVLFGLSVF
ncbi:MAG: membrane protein of unknown function [Promethearchaeota archaeon]|nr:MAG: membrane protein of unknown function [Candidatus Lokiarchaeota archaeon]